MQPVRVPPRIETITLRGTDVSYIVRRHPRAKSCKITITPFHGVVVTLPLRLQRYFDHAKFLLEKQDWVLAQLTKLDIHPTPRPLADGSVIYYRGRPHSLRLQAGQLLQGCTVVDDELHVHMPHDFEGDVRTVLLSWIKRQAVDQINTVTRELADEIGVHYTRLTIRDQKTKWGSCSKAGAISLNWRLILFPPDVLRYVVLHELCHLKHFNHSKRFWALVERHDPRFEESVEWLREHGLRVEAALR